MHFDAAGLLLASMTFEDGKHLALGAGAVGIVLTGGPALASRLGRAPARGTYSYGLDRVRTFMGCIGLCLAAIGLVMMVKGSGWST